jgi:hypothetical protein
MKKALVIGAGIDLLILAVIFHTPLKDFLYVHPWLLSVLAAIPALAIPFLELLHSHEANELRRQANQLRDEANEQRRDANAERAKANEALEQIALHTKEDTHKSGAKRGKTTCTSSSKRESSKCGR